MGTKNKLADLTNLLFEQMERLSQPDIDKDNLEMEILRGKAMSDIAKTVIESGQLALNAQRQFDEFRGDVKVNLPLIEVKEK